MSETIETADVAGEKYLIFSILDQLYTFPTKLVGEVALFEAVYPLPLVPQYVLGIINRYSIPHALFDIGLLLFNTPSPRAKVLVLKDSVDRIAFLVDDVNGIAEVPKEKFIAVERSAEADDQIEAVSASFSWEGKEVFVLDIHLILDRVAAGAF
ncbi:MAG: chemotaxis protein CheW [Treponema sp.]|nr:chemotaxis protein CheW [Treponema sp.]